MKNKKIADQFRCFARNGRWGTCASCPRDSDHNVYPEFCVYTERYDHQYDVDALARVYKATEVVEKVVADSDRIKSGR